MTSALRILIWLLTVSFAASPVLLTVASSPARDHQVFDPVYYMDYGRDVAFVIVAVIAIGMADAFEVVATLFGPHPAKPWVAFLAVVLMLVFIPFLTVAVSWAAPGLKMTPGDITEILNFGKAALICAFGTRLLSML